tara:strand:+ start:1134 stop:1274 length:141 start_codon:yes stop_codon:yes gene_type:complete
MDFDKKIEDLQKTADNFRNAYMKCMGAIEFLQLEKEAIKKDKKKDK